MKKFIVLSLLLASGCSDAMPPKKNEKICSCLPHPSGEYIVNVEFKDGEKIRSFPYKVEWNGYIWKGEPESLYVTNGKYFSIEAPCRMSNGLIIINQVDGPVVQVDFKDIEAIMIPCKVKELDPVSTKIKESGINYLASRKACERHRERAESQ